MPANNEWEVGTYNVSFGYFIPSTGSMVKRSAQFNNVASRKDLLTLVENQARAVAGAEVSDVEVLSYSFDKAATSKGLKDWKIGSYDVSFEYTNSVTKERIEDKAQFDNVINEVELRSLVEDIARSNIGDEVSNVELISFDFNEVATEDWGKWQEDLVRQEELVKEEELIRQERLAKAEDVTLFGLYDFDDFFFATYKELEDDNYLIIDRPILESISFDEWKQISKQLVNVADAEYFLLSYVDSFSPSRSISEYLDEWVNSNDMDGFNSHESYVDAIKSFDHASAFFRKNGLTDWTFDFDLRAAERVFVSEGITDPTPYMLEEALSNRRNLLVAPDRDREFFEDVETLARKRATDSKILVQLEELEAIPKHFDNSKNITDVIARDFGGDGKALCEVASGHIAHSYSALNLALDDAGIYGVTTPYNFAKKLYTSPEIIDIALEALYDLDVSKIESVNHELLGAVVDVTGELEGYKAAYEKYIEEPSRIREHNEQISRDVIALSPEEKRLIAEYPEPLLGSAVQQFRANKPDSTIRAEDMKQIEALSQNMHTEDSFSEPSRSFNQEVSRSTSRGAR